MAKKVNRMVHDSLQSVVRVDTALARTVLEADDEIDTAHTGMYRSIRHLMEEDPACIKRAIHALSASRYLERIADLSTNIAEDLIFMVDGEVIRHGMDRMIDNVGD